MVLTDESSRKTGRHFEEFQKVLKGRSYNLLPRLAITLHGGSMCEWDHVEIIGRRGMLGRAEWGGFWSHLAADGTQAETACA